MKKISYYLIFAVIIGGLISSFWVYRKYFHKEKNNFLFFQVERGPISEIVKVRGEVVPKREFDLEFPFSGIVEKIFVKEGQAAAQGAPLMKLDTKDYELEVKRLEAALSQRTANLEKLIAGPTEDDVNISKTKVSNAEISLGEAKKIVLVKLNDAYTKSDDAVRGKADQFFSNPRSANPELDFNTGDSRLTDEIERKRFSVEAVLTSWADELKNLSPGTGLHQAVNSANGNLSEIKSFLAEAALAVNGAQPNIDTPQTTIDAWKTDVSSARSGVNAAIAALSAAEEKMKTAESNLALAESELAFKTSGARPEDIEIAKARIEAAKNQIASAREKITKSHLYAPADVDVVKIPIEEGELFSPGAAAVSLSSSELKISADVSELDIGKLRNSNGNDVLIKFDAFPGADFSGKVSFIEPKEIVRDGDVYYRVNVLFKPGKENIRSGMSADLEIIISTKENALKIPELAVYPKNGENFVKIFEGGRAAERKILLGISDGEFVEVAGGLGEGQTVVVSAD